MDQYLFLVPGFLIGLTVHEAAHALVSKWLGDRYAESQGRVSLNPLRHLSGMGTLMMFIAGFGWGKPVPVNLYNYKHPKFYYLLSSLAGPASNLLLCGIALAGLHGLAWYGHQEISIPETVNTHIIYWGWFGLTSILYINAILAVFNLIPIPPLDGSKIWPCLIPGMRPVWTGKATWVWFILLIFLMKGDVTSRMVINPAISFLNTLLPENYSDKEEEAETQNEDMPANYPAEMKAPEEALNVSYESETINDKGDPNSFFTYYFVEDPYPGAKKVRKQLAERLSGLGWSEIKTANQDPNRWELEEIVDGDKVDFRLLSLFQVWKKGQCDFRIKLSYYVDPNGRIIQDSQELVHVEYNYIINDSNGR